MARSRDAAVIAARRDEPAALAMGSLQSLRFAGRGNPVVAAGLLRYARNDAIGAGKYITRKLYVEVVTDGAGYSATQVEYQMTRWLSLLSTISTIGRQSASIRVSKDY